MRYNYENSFKQYKTAMRTYVRSSAKRRFWFHFQMWGLLLIGLSLAFSTTATGALITHNALLAPLIGGLVGGGVVGPILRPWSLRRSYNAWCGESKGKQAFVEVCGEELHCGIEGRSETLFQRNAICETAEDDAMLLLFLNRKKFLYLSKSFLPASALDEIHAWLQLPGGPASC